jgi:hypothetical protein
MKPNERKLKMKSNLAIIADQAIVSPKASDKPAKPQVTTVAQGVKIPALNSSDPIFSRTFGTEGHTLGEAIEHQAQVYKGLVKQRKGQLDKLRGIGLVLIELRSVSGASDKDYGKLVAKTSLGIMSRQDRSDAMWLAENWANVQSFMKDLDMQSCSAAYLRQQMRKAQKAPATVEDATQKPAKPTVEDATQKPAKSDDDADDATEVDVSDVSTFASSMASIAKAQGFTVADLIAELQKLA